MKGKSLSFGGYFFFRDIIGGKIKEEISLFLPIQYTFFLYVDNYIPADRGEREGLQHRYQIPHHMHVALSLTKI